MGPAMTMVSSMPCCKSCPPDSATRRDVLGGLLAKGAAGLVLIGPTLAQHDFKPISASAIPKLIVGADNDFATPLETTNGWFSACAPPKQLVIVPAAEHFYRGQEDRIVKEILQWMPE